MTGGLKDKNVGIVLRWPSLIAKDNADAETYGGSLLGKRMNVIE